MGCDIHMYVEYKRSINSKDTWVSGDYFKMNPYYKTDEYEREFECIELYGDRNYTLFSTIAGVRDYTDKVVPVSEPKGIPEDATAYVKQENERWDGDGHTHSWLTLKEIKEYQEKAPSMHYTGLISPDDVIAFDKEGTTPRSWCQGTNQAGWERRDWTEENKSLVPLIEVMQARAKELMQYEWQDYDTNNDDKIQIVFWFDN